MNHSVRLAERGIDKVEASVRRVRFSGEGGAIANSSPQVHEPSLGVAVKPVSSKVRFQPNPGLRALCVPSSCGKN
jgi:hypothetical protein